MKKKLVLTKPYPGLRSIMQPGEYLIPEDISLGDAKAARGDGAGTIELVDAELAEGSANAGRMFSAEGGAPEHKEQRPAPPSIDPPANPRPSAGGRRQARR